LAKGKQRDGRRKKSNDLFALVIGGAIAYVIFAGRFGVIFVACAWIFAFMIWMMFFMNTYCDYDLGHRGCIRQVYGKLRGCHDHARLKRDAIWAALGRRNPGSIFRLTWSNRTADPGRRTPGGAPQPGPPRRDDDARPEVVARQGAYNASMWVFTAVSAVAAVAALFLPK
jgi:hypothetical protein